MRSDSEQMYLIAWLGESMPPTWATDASVQSLLAKGFITQTPKGYQATDQGRASLSPNARQACNRPLNYADLSPADQWAIDKRLGILDWDGD